MRNRNRLVWPVLALGLLLMPLFARSAIASKIQTNGRPVSAAIAYSPTFDTYLMVWAEDRNTGTGLDLYAARLTSSGIVQGISVPLVVAPGNQSDPSLVFSQRVNQFLVVYTNDGGPSSPGLPNPGATSAPGLPTPNPFAASAAPIGQAGLTLNDVPGSAPSGPAAPDQPYPTATPGGPVAPPTAPGARDIWGVWANTNGFPSSNTFALVNSPADETFPDLANSNAGGGDKFVLAWREVTGTDVAIDVQDYVGGFGYYLIIDGPKAVVVTGGDKGKPSVAAEQSKGDFLVVWSETSTKTSTRDIYARSLNANAYPVGPIRSLVVGAGDDLNPSVASLGPFGGYLMAWEYREAGTGAPPDIRTIQLNRNGLPYAGTNYSLAGGPDYSFLPDVASVSRSTALVLWLDRNAASDHSIIAREVNRSGRPLAPVRVVVQGGTGPDGGATPVVPPPGLPTPHP